MIPRFPQLCDAPHGERSANLEFPLLALDGHHRLARSF